VLIDADLIVRELQEAGAPVFRAMVDRWGPSIVATDGSLDRQAVADIVFNDAGELEALNAIVHPAVGAEMTARRAALADTDSVVILDIPLLVRDDGRQIRSDYRDLAGIVVVDVDPELAVERLVANRQMSEEDARARVANQAGRGDRLAVADFVIDNSGSLEDLDAELDRLWDWIVSLAASL
jgi:dephospho-CoA kinase